MDKNIRIFHSAFHVSGRSKFSANRITTINGNCTFVCRRTTDTSLDVAVSFCHTRDTFRDRKSTRLNSSHRT